MDQFLGWLVPVGDFVVGIGNNATKRGLRTNLHDEFPTHRDYPNELHVAENLIKVVAQTLFDHVVYFSVSGTKIWSRSDHLVNDPTSPSHIKIKGDKENHISEEDYLKRFKNLHGSFG